MADGRDAQQQQQQPMVLDEPSLQNTMDEADEATEAWLASLRPPSDWDPRPSGSPSFSAAELGSALVATKGLKQLRIIGELSACGSFGDKLGKDDQNTLALWAELEADHTWVTAIKSEVLQGISVTKSSSAADLERGEAELDRLFFDADNVCRRPRRLVREFFRVGRPTCWVW